MGLLTQTDEAQTGALDYHAKRFSAFLSDFYTCIVRIVNPVDARSYVDCDAIREVWAGLLESPIGVGGVRCCRAIHDDMERIWVLGMSQKGH